MLIGVPSLSSRRRRKQSLLRLLESSDGLLSRDRREIVQEVGERMATFQVVDQSLEWHTRSDEDAGTAEGLRVAVNHPF
ncbi:MAG: hypothetical protein JWN02_1721 [Acidobacteria bacterium]|nr:hypothetical protein [Acidobacteriota bacterium]